MRLQRCLKQHTDSNHLLYSSHSHSSIQLLLSQCCVPHLGLETLKCSILRFLILLLLLLAAIIAGC
jgi:hypothetical protein